MYDAPRALTNPCSARALMNPCSARALMNPCSARALTNPCAARALTNPWSACGWRSRRGTGWPAASRPSPQSWFGETACCLPVQ
eukprot:scaffold3466_cov132-Isochrysis_galbana.AAC.4